LVSPARARAQADRPLVKTALGDDLGFGGGREIGGGREEGKRITFRRGGEKIPGKIRGPASMRVRPAHLDKVEGRSRSEKKKGTVGLCGREECTSKLRLPYQGEERPQSLEGIGEGGRGQRSCSP